MGDATITDVVARVEALEAKLARLEAHRHSAAGVAADVPSRDLEAAAPEPSASRRDLLRYGAVALGAAAAGLAPRSAEAADGDPVLVGGVHAGTNSTGFFSNGNNVLVLYGNATNVSTGTGVFGGAAATSGTGVWGQVIASTGFTTAVRGDCFSATGFAVWGRNFAGGTAVQGEIPGSASGNGIAIYGVNNSSYAGPGPGAGGFGVYGLSAKGHGLVGATSAAGGAAVVGATNGVAGAYAGAFYGPVVVSGAFTVVGGPKSAAVPHPDGSHRLVYCVESPESWFEDFGKGRLQCGRTEVTIDPDFAAIVDLADYHVFVTMYDQPNDLTVSERTARGFRVTAKDETSVGTFSWRVVARRRDITGERLAKVTIPIEPTLPIVPPVPESQLARSRHVRS